MTAVFTVARAFMPEAVSLHVTYMYPSYRSILLSNNYSSKHSKKESVLVCNSRKINSCLPESKTRKILFGLKNTCMGRKLGHTTVQAQKVARWLESSRATPAVRGCRSEEHIHKILIDYPPSPFTEVVAHEWEGDAETPFDVGVGDIVFKRPRSNEYLVIEAKYIGRNAQKQTKTKKRRHVKEQAQFYGRKASKILSPFALVHFAYCTNEVGIQYMGNYRFGKEMMLSPKYM